ncbi:MAG: ribosome silencing factor [Endomicrobium sp.]|jgi:ribosome-associated protein|nr:ribosome silencing factor [Endomicrobium sp.]
MENIDFEAFAKKAAQIAMDKKADGASILDVRELTEMTNLFVIVTANSTPQINAVCTEIEDKFEEDGLELVRREGRSSQNWRVIDYGGVIIHIMTPQSRQIYKLEEFWQKAKVIKFEEEKERDIKAIVKDIVREIKPQIKKIQELKKQLAALKGKKKSGKVKKIVKKAPTTKTNPAKKKIIKKSKPISRQLKKISGAKRIVKKSKKSISHKKGKKVIKNAKKK